MTYTLIALTISFTILGVHYILSSLLDNLLDISLDDILDEFGKISLPIIVCPTCMTSVWGLPLLLLFPYDLTNYEYFITFFQIGFFNYVFTKLIP
jgi:hypothetical protein